MILSTAHSTRRSLDRSIASINHNLTIIHALIVLILTKLVTHMHSIPPIDRFHIPLTIKQTNKRNEQNIKKKKICEPYINVICVWSALFFCTMWLWWWSIVDSAHFVSFLFVCCCCWQFACSADDTTTCGDIFFVVSLAVHLDSNVTSWMIFYLWICMMIGFNRNCYGNDIANNRNGAWWTIICSTWPIERIERMKKNKRDSKR